MNEIDTGFKKLRNSYSDLVGERQQSLDDILDRLGSVTAKYELSDSVQRLTLSSQSDETVVISGMNNKKQEDKVDRLVLVIYSESPHEIDLDQLMAARHLTAIVVTGEAHDNPPRSYLSNGAHVTGGYIIKRPGSDPIMIVNGMETEEAAKSGLQVLSHADLGYAQMISEAKGDLTKAGIALWGAMLRRFDIPTGRIGIYGVGNLHSQIEFTRLLSAAYPAYQFVGETGLDPVRRSLHHQRRRRTAHHPFGGAAHQ